MRCPACAHRRRGCGGGVKSRFSPRPLRLKQETLVTVRIPRHTSIPAVSLGGRRLANCTSPRRTGGASFALARLRQGFRCTTKAEHGRWLSDDCERKSDCWGPANRALDCLDSQRNGSGLKASAWLERPPRFAPSVSWFCLGWGRRRPATENSDQHCQRGCCFCWSKPPTLHSARLPNKLKPLRARCLSALRSTSPLPWRPSADTPASLPRRHPCK